MAGVEALAASLTRWQSRLAALCKTCGTAAGNCQEPAAYDTGVAGPRRSTGLFPRALVYYSEVEVATTAGAATAAELPALRRRHCEAAAVIHRQAVG